MGLMNYLRNRAGVVIVVFIGFAIFAFLLGDVINYGTPFWARHQNQVGSINGEVIDINEFNAQVDQTSEMFRQQMGGGTLNPQMKSYAVQQVWGQYLNRELLRNEVERIGLTVGKTELNDLVQGDNPSMQVQQAFRNPQTGQFDRGQLNNFIAQVGTLPQGHEAHAQWDALLQSIMDEQLSTKYTNLINNSIYVTSLEANEEYSQRNKLANFDYVLLDYESVSDSSVTLSEQDYKDYYNENKGVFKNEEETRSLEYVVFDASPTAEDTARVQTTIEELKAQLAESTTDSLFAAVNSDTKYPYIFRKQGEFSPALDTLVFGAPVGTTVGPVLANGRFEIAKIIDTKVGPDSVKASHILLNPATEGGMDKAQAKADSIKGLIEKGESFAALAVQFSIDEGSKVNGGELGTFGRGMMVPAFENAAFDAKEGAVVITNSQFGIHIIKVEDQIGSSRVVKAAIIDKQINSGKETMNAAYNKATQFFGAVNENNFQDVATQQSVSVLKADNITAMETMLMGTEVPRELVRWAFDADQGDISDKIYESDTKYIVARVTGIREKGQLPLEAVKSEIEPIVRNRVKAKKLTAQVDEAAKGATTLTQIGEKLGKTPASAENIVFANPVIPGVAQENAVVGTVFGLQPKQPSKPIRGSQGVYVVAVTGFVNPEAPSDLSAQKKQMTQSQAQRTWSRVFQALQNKADIVDNRARFF
ncbi:peptidyl-prolyl cis-trans isomerase D [Parapedobacter indicus]|uniref:Periplasmic chaperone PpiD n=2 Tax=Parapedobacter indicus TaxID=1477437 RepID=A0A1I3GYD8_9SPHI|nr:SurA N-terminal domain-containing protein [Parapedobacter indicus]PPL02826.1 peptidyl-prolyl cis-trans isomerase D [Parapedobacter indicus]SFI28322.1 peptidyl-prolyl cis-trans isomerase D [Parapedobacter indicus]